MKACASREPHYSAVARIGSYRSLACVSLLCPRPEQEDDDELRARRRGGRLEARSRALKTPAWPRQANGRNTRRQQYSSVYSTSRQRNKTLASLQ